MCSLVVACSTNTGGLGTMSSSEGSGDDPTAATEAVTTTSATTEAGTLDGPGSGSGSATSDGSSSGTSDATSTTDGSGDGSGSGSGDESSGSESGGGPGVGEPYGPCDDQGGCLGDNQCYDDYQTFDMCLAPCGPGPVFACPDAPGGTAFPECIGAVGVLCMLNCQGGLECPEGTTCEEVFGGIFRCLWP